MKPLLDQAPDARTAMASLPETATASVQIVDPLAVPNWDALVSSLPGNTFFHSSAWARVLEQSYGYEPRYFAKTENGQLRALLPTMEVNSWLTGKRGISLPFSDVCEPIANDPADIVELYEAACAEGRKRKWKYLEIRGNVGPDAGPASESFFDHFLRLSTDEEKVFAALESSVRRAIRKSEKSNVKVEISRSLEGVQCFYELHCQTRQKHGVPPQPFSFFANFHRHVIAQNIGFVVIARFEGKPIAASVFVHTDTKAIYKYGASDENFQNLRGANLVMWHAIEWYARAGFTEFGFGRTDKANEGLRRFKLGWGAEERLVQYFKRDLRTGGFVPEKPGTSSVRERIMQRIPIPMARIIGSVLYRHVG
jgi:CelD/BcsL family acetyltransferase involved in cellulose biosynthesis